MKNMRDPLKQGLLPTIMCGCINTESKLYQHDFLETLHRFIGTIDCENGEILLRYIRFSTTEQ